MCIVLFDWRPGTDTPLIVAANRDEFHARVAQPARWRGPLFCGLDQVGGGTWLGIHREGRFAVVTNFREPLTERAQGERSRGLLPLAFLEGDQGPEAFCRVLREEQNHYAGFNLLVGDRQSLWYLGNRGAPPQPLAPGLYGMSNGLLDDPWPKVERGKARLAEAIAAGADPDDLLEVVNDRHRPADALLPNTGVDLELERLVAPVFIRSERYGTRASSAVKLHATGVPEMAERNWCPDGEPDGRVRYSHLLAPDRG